MNNKWNQRGTRFDIGSVASMKDSLDKGIYSVEMDPNTGQLFLNKLKDSFEFNYKTYGIQEKFIDRVVKTYASTNGNLGILLNGVKGTGKSVTAKMLCNSFDMPVILVNKGFKGIPDFINNIQQDIIVFIDEFEKVFKSDDYSDNSTDLLTIMDGVLENGSRKMFLLTTNHLRVNENLLQRPGRVRYLKTFSDLDKETIEMIVDDLLIHTELRNEVVKFISRLEIITVDIVKAVVSEVNIHEESPESFADVFNVKRQNDVFKAYFIDEATRDKVFIKTISQENLDSLMYPDNDDYYISLNIRNKSYNSYEVISLEDMIFKVSRDDYDGDKKMYVKKFETVQVEKVVPFHYSYAI